MIAGQKPSESAEEQTHTRPQPTQLSNDAVSEGWGSVGGHAAVIQQLKEMVLLPLQYPEVFKHMGVTPPRYYLFFMSMRTLSVWNRR